MANVTLREFYRFFQSDMPKVPNSISDIAIVDTLRDFCAATLLWVRTSDWADILAGQSTYGFTSPAGTEQCHILHVDYRPSVDLMPTEVRPTNVDWLDRNRSQWRDETGLAPQLFISREPGVIRLIPYPALTDGDQLTSLRVEVAMAPSIDATSVPDFFYTSWGSVIGNGVKARLMAQPKQPWSGDPTYYKMLYERGVSSGRTKASRGSTKGSMRVQIPLQGRR